MGIGISNTITNKAQIAVITFFFIQLHAFPTIEMYPSHIFPTLQFDDVSFYVSCIYEICPFVIMVRIIRYHHFSNRAATVCDHFFQSFFYIIYFKSQMRKSRTIRFLDDAFFHFVI